MFALLCSPPSTVGLPPNFHASGSSSGRSDDQQPVKDAKKDAKKKPAAAVKSKAGKKKGDEDEKTDNEVNPLCEKGDDKDSEGDQNEDIAKRPASRTGQGWVN